MKRALIALVAVPLLLVGCNSTGDTKPTVTKTTFEVATPSGDPSAAATLPPKSDVYVDTANSQADGDFVGAASDVTSSECSGEGGTWTGWGTVLNSTTDVVNYRVWVAFVDSTGGTAGLVESDFDGVESGATGDYSASMPYPGADALTCVLRVERRTA